MVLSGLVSVVQCAAQHIRTTQRNQFEYRYYHIKGPDFFLKEVLPMIVAEQLARRKSVCMQMCHNSTPYHQVALTPYFNFKILSPLTWNFTSFYYSFYTLKAKVFLWCVCTTYLEIVLRIYKLFFYNNDPINNASLSHPGALWANLGKSLFLCVCACVCSVLEGQRLH